MKTFKDIIFKRHRLGKGHIQGLLMLDNGVEISIVAGTGMYSAGKTGVRGPVNNVKDVSSFEIAIFDQEGELYDAGGYYSETKDKLRNRSTRLRFPKEYNAGIVIVKAERGVNSEIDRQSQAHVIQEAYPYSVDSVPLSFGMDSLVKVTANFHYSKHFVKYTDQRTA